MKIGKDVLHSWKQVYTNMIVNAINDDMVTKDLTPQERAEIVWGSFEELLNSFTECQGSFFIRL